MTEVSELSRRAFLATGAAAGAAALSPGVGLAQASARYRRLNVSNPQAARVLESYKRAITAMLKLLPTDPRNWYRLALIHTVDCPHGNWWFLPWHRGFIGWFEQICRELSDDPDFALPYWDWTQEPRVPQVMYDGVLTPTDPLYIGALSEFEAQYKDAVARLGYWVSSPFDPNSQYGQLLARGMRFPDDLWFDIGKDPRGLLFFDRAHARGLTKDKPEFDQRTRDAASLATLLNALAPRDFITFGSPQTIAHSGLTGFGVLEGFPHNKVHNCVGGIFKDSNGMTTDVGGFMQANLSPVDPLFMLHHANIDRIWDVWTRKQQASNQPTLPSGVDASGNPIVDKWKSERFVFFVDNKGKPVTKTTAGDYAEIGEFNYDYEPGSGEEVVPVRVAAAPAAPVERFGVTGTGGRLTLPAALLRSEQNAPPPRLFAKVTLDLPPSAHQGVSVDIDGTTFDLSMFGHHTIQAPVTFTLPLTAPLANRNNTLNFSVAQAPMAMRPGVAMSGPEKVEVLSIVVERH